MASVSWTVGGLQDFRSVIQRRAFRGNPTRLREDLTRSISQIEQFPLAGRVVPEYSLIELREVIVGRHRLIYRVTEDQARIYAIIDGSRELRRRLGPDPLEKS
jgi:toxin ParE1/3/4